METNGAVLPEQKRTEAAEPNKPKAVLSAASLLVSGLSVGWLIGLSVSPVVHIVVASVVGIVVSALAAFSGVQLGSNPSNDGSEDLAKQTAPTKPKLTVSTVNLLPIAIFTFSLALGSSLGVLARTNQLLGIYPRYYMARWTNVDGSKQLAIAQLLRSSAGSAPEEPSKSSGVNALNGSLFSFHLDPATCGTLKTQQGVQLQTLIKKDAPQALWPIVDSCTSDSCLIALRELVCPSDQH